MESFRIVVELVASFLLFIEFKRILKVIQVCRLHEIKCTGSYIQGAGMFLVSALLILGFYSDLEKAPHTWLGPSSYGAGALTQAGPQHPAPESHTVSANPDVLSEAIPPREGVVARVIDGDTILLGDGERVTYLGVDAPEVVHPRKPVEPLGREAYALNRQLVEGKRVRLDFDKHARDRYNRVVAYVFTGDVFVNAELVRSGLARLTTRTQEGRYALLLGGAELEARQENRGLWALR